MHLFGELQDEDDVGSLIRVGTDAHTDQISELKRIERVVSHKSVSVMTDGVWVFVPSVSSVLMGAVDNHTARSSDTTPAGSSYRCKRGCVKLPSERINVMQ